MKSDVESELGSPESQWGNGFLAELIHGRAETEGLANVADLLPRGKALLGFQVVVGSDLMKLVTMMIEMELLSGAGASEWLVRWSLAISSQPFQKTGQAP